MIKAALFIIDVQLFLFLYVGVGFLDCTLHCCLCWGLFFAFAGFFGVCLGVGNEFVPHCLHGLYVGLCRCIYGDMLVRLLWGNLRVPQDQWINYLTLQGESSDGTTKGRAWAIHNAFICRMGFLHNNRWTVTSNVNDGTQ